MTANFIDDLPELAGTVGGVVFDRIDDKVRTVPFGTLIKDHTIGLAELTREELEAECAELRGELADARHDLSIVNDDAALAPRVEQLEEELERVKTMAKQLVDAGGGVDPVVLTELFAAWVERQLNDEQAKWPKKTRLFADGAVDALADILAGRLR